MSLPLIISFYIIIELPFAIAAATVATGDRTNLSSIHITTRSRCIFCIFSCLHLKKYSDFSE